MRTHPITARQIKCPVEPEVLLAAIQEELQIEEARDVHQHLDECSFCHSRYDELYDAYMQIGILAQVDSIPQIDISGDILQESRGRLRVVRVARKFNLPLRTFFLLGSGSVIVVLILIMGVIGPFLRNNVLNTPPSHNILTKVPAIGAGALYAETNKLIQINRDGITWNIHEVVQIDEKTGHVLRSLPSSSQHPIQPGLGISGNAALPPVISGDGQTIIAPAQPTGTNDDDAVVVFDAIHGTVHNVIRLHVPPKADQQAPPIIQKMWLNQNGTIAYFLTSLSYKGDRSPHIIEYDLKNNTELNTVIPDFGTPALLGGTLDVITADGQYWLDGQIGKDKNNTVGFTITFVKMTANAIMGNLFLPGSFSASPDITKMMVSADGTQAFIFNGSTATVTFVSIPTMSISSVLSLQGSTIGESTNPFQSASASMAITPDGQHLILGLDYAGTFGKIYSIWTVNVGQQAFESLTRLNLTVGQVGSSSDSTSGIVQRSDGTLEWFNINRPGSPQPWVKLDNSTPIIMIIGAEPLTK